MSGPAQDLLLENLSREELEKLASVLADVIIVDAHVVQVEYTVVSIEYLEQIDLDQMITSVGGITDPLGQLKDWLTDMFNTIAEWIVSSVSSLIDNLWNSLIKPALDTISDLTSKIWDFIRESFESLSDTLSSIASTIQSVVIDPIMDALNWIGENIPRLADTLSSILSKATEFLRDLQQRISDIVSSVSDSLAALVDNMANSLINAVAETASRIGEVLSRITESVATITDTMIKSIKQAIDEIMEAVKNLPQYATTAVENIEAWIWENMPDWVKTFLEEAPKALNQVATTIQGFVNAVMNIPTWIKDIANLVSSGLQASWDQLVKFGEWLWGGLQSFATTIFDSVTAAAETLYDMITKAASKVNEIVQELLGDIFTKPFKILAEKADQIIGKLFGGGGELDVVFTLYTEIILQALPALIFVSVLKSIAKILPTTEISLEPLGLGGKLRVPIGDVVATVPATALDLYLSMIAGTAVGLSMNIMTPYQYMIRPRALEALSPHFEKSYGVEAFFEIPTLTEVREMLRRAMVKVKDFEKLIKGEVPEGYKQIYDTITKIFRLYGYPKWFLDYYFDLGKQFSMIMTDRFGTKRVIPFSPLFTVPTHAEVVRMLQRDVFMSPMEWARFVKIYGWSDDLAKLYYLYSFSYPGFEKLWEFMTRGISGMLWYEPPELAKKIFEKDAEWLGAGVPVPPRKLNFDYKALFTATNFYLKWIQKSNFSWFKKGAKLKYGDMEITIDFDWTADSWLLWDVAADIPGKIDARWMAKWALFDHLTSKANIEVPKAGATVRPLPETPFIDLVKKIVEPNLKTEIKMDLRPFCRLLIAHGLHPAWTPITAVAEAINALADERTLLRTGFINLFKEGFWTYEKIDELLAGFFIASFAVEYFDVEKQKWISGAINVPVRFLPAERKLLELRALMDRALDILRDYVKEINRAYAENVIEEVNEYMKGLNNAVSSINTWFKEQIKAITGKELELVVDKKYWSAYVHVIELYRSIYEIHRIRYWVGRTIGWIIYRLAYGYVKIEDYRHLVDTIKKYAKLLPNEEKLLYELGSMVIGIASREYIPTPSQLASIAEIIPAARRYIGKVFEERQVPREWWPLWTQYIVLKPFIDEVKKMVTRLTNLYEYFAIKEDDLRKALEKLKPFGYEDLEIDMIVYNAKLDATLRAYRELIGTPRELLVMAEYSPSARSVALGQVYKMIDALPVDPQTKEFIKKMWEEFIRIKPVHDEVKRYITELISDYAAGVIDDNTLKQELEQLKQWGLDDYEIQFYIWLAKRRRIRYEARRSYYSY